MTNNPTIDGVPRWLPGCDEPKTFSDAKGQLADAMRMVAQLQARVAQLEGEKELMLRGAEVYKERIAELENLHAEVYQVLGALDASEQVLDKVSAAANSEPIPEIELLPYTAPPAPVSAEMVRLLTRAGKYAQGEFRAEIAACLEKVKDAPVAVVPDGWKLVPVEPTTAMIEAAINTPVEDTGDDEVDQSQDYKNMWCSMLNSCLDATAALNGPAK
ncbi:hypothetical protein [Pseudomonas sp. SDO52101_S400]